MNIALHRRSPIKFEGDKRHRLIPVHVDVSNLGWTATNGSRVLENINLTIDQGEFVSIVGPSGSGKSSLLRVISGLEKPTSGELIFSLKDHETSPSSIGFVFQDATLLPWANVQRNVGLPLELLKYPKNEIDKKVEEILDFVGLDHAAKLYPDQMSGGMKMRASIARALVTNPDLLLMDEPFGALDEQSRSQLDEDLLKLSKQKKMTVLFVTHSVYEAAFLSDRVLVMAPHPGRLVDEISIEGPPLRDHTYRMTPTFFDTCASIQQSLTALCMKGRSTYV
jgi:NitT/TauT family transport system ATP-binding protein